jgi:N-methylhydantoinase B
MASKMDPITAQVIRSALVSLAEEMKLTLLRTAYSPLIYEVNDFACGLLTSEGETLAQAAGLPIFLQSFPSMIKNGLKTIGKGNFEDGDIIIANSPYTGGTHLSDTAIYMPVFYHGELVAFAATMAHWADVGGKNPGGWSTDTTDIYQEGMIFEDLKLYKAGEPDENLLRYIASNVRYPAAVSGDLQAQIASARLGVRRYKALCDKYGSATVRRCMAWIFDHSDELVRAKIAGWPNGSYEAQCYSDHDGIELDKPRLVKMTVNIREDTVLVDFSGSSETAAGPINCPLVGVEAAVGIGLLSLIAPRDPINSGHMRPLQVVAPPNTIVNPQRPAPCDSYGYVGNRVVDLFFKALSQALPDVAPAGSIQVTGLFLHRLDPRFGKPFIFAEPFCGGYGACPSRDGASALIYVGDGDCHNEPAEIIETRYPIMLERHELDTNSAGAGKYRGGFGVIRDYRILAEGVFLMYGHDTNINPPWGLHGGKDAAAQKVILNEGTEKQQVLLDRVSFYGPLQIGDRLSFRTSGGGGWGDPLERDAELVERDVQLGYLSKEQARDVYGVAIGEDGTVDHERTAALRQSKTRQG